MKSPEVKLSLLALLCLWFDHCESLTDSSVPEIFFPFGTDEGDSVVTVGYKTCDGPIDIPYEIFNHRTIYVSSRQWRLSPQLLLLPSIPHSPFSPLSPPLVLSSIPLETSLGVWGSAVSYPSGVLGSPSRHRFWCILRKKLI